MNYPKRNYIKVILILLGTHPFHERQKTKWYQKIHLIGSVFCAVQLVLTLYTFIWEQNSGAFASTNTNNILNGSVLIKKIVAIGLPFFTVFVKCFSIRNLETFHEKIESFDVFLQSTEFKDEEEFMKLQKEMELKRRKINFFSVLLIVLMEMFNVITAFSYMLFARGLVPQFETMYFYHSPIAIFISTAVYIYGHFYGITLRHEMLNSLVLHIWERGWTTENEQQLERKEQLRELALIRREAEKKIIPSIDF